VVEKKQAEMKQTQQQNKRTNIQHGEEKLQMKRACMCTQESRSNLNFKKFAVAKNASNSKN